MKSALITSAFLCLAAVTAVADVVLVEAEAFSHPGGWKADTQSVEQMGSVYLLAHGLGTPVADARAVVGLPVAGAYHVWVRTRNWVPGSWSAPGRFKVTVNGSELATVFGTGSEVWQWQDGGMVTLTAPTATLVLKDLSGFDGRCDAIALISGSDAPPPTEMAELKAWRRTVKNEAASPSDVRRFDGLSNLIEYLTGCDPCDSSSHFDAQMAMDRSAGTFALTWPSAEGRTYRIEASADCITWQTIAGPVPATPPLNQHDAPIIGSSKYFRVVLEP